MHKPVKPIKTHPQTFSQAFWCVSTHRTHKIMRLNVTETIAKTFTMHKQAKPIKTHPQAFLQLF